MKKSQRNKLTDTQYAVAREGATEAPFSGKYNDEKRAGIYICTSCNHKLFDSKKNMIADQDGQRFTLLLKNQV